MVQSAAALGLFLCRSTLPLMCLIVYVPSADIGGEHFSLLDSSQALLFLLAELIHDCRRICNFMSFKIVVAFVILLCSPLIQH